MTKAYPGIPPGNSTVAGDAVGREAVFAQFGRYGGETQGSLKADLKELFGSEDGKVLGLHHNSAIKSGKTLDTDRCIVFELYGGKIVSGREHFCDLHNWDNFWS